MNTEANLSTSEIAQDTTQSDLPVARILIDTTFLLDQFSMRGIGRYGKQILKRLLKTFEENKWEVHFIGFETLEKNLIALGLSQFSLEHTLGKVKFHSMGETVPSGVRNITRWLKFYKPIIEEVKPDVFFAVHFERGLPTIPYFYNKLNHHPKTIVTVHDVIPLATDKFSQKGSIQNKLKKMYYEFMFNGAVSADVVMTDSEFSRQDIIKYGKIPEDKVKVVYLGIDETFYKDSMNLDQDVINHTLEAFNVLNEKYYFYDSGLEANKGINELLEIFAKIVQKEDENLAKKLVITGKDFVKGVGKDIKARTIQGDRVLKLAEKLGIAENLIATDKISDEDLNILLFNATAYLNFSKYEGFHFGPVQAMAAGIPAIAANASCTPEITAGGAMLVDTNDIDKASDEIIALLSNKRKITPLVKKAKEIAKRYNWDDTVEKTYKLIESLIHST